MPKTIYENGEWVPAHTHHIVPKHAGGTDDPENLIDLSIPGHAEAHRLLFDEYGRWQDDLAWLMLSGMIGKEEFIQISQIENGKTRAGSANGMFGKQHSPNTRKKITNSLLDLYSTHPERHWYGPHKEETKDKIRATLLSEDNPWRGQTHKPETIVKMRKMKEKFHYIITHPDGKITETNNLKQFCREHNLKSGAMCRVANGQRSHHHGYTVVKSVKDKY